MAKKEFALAIKNRKLSDLFKDCGTNIGGLYTQPRVDFENKDIFIASREVLESDPDSRHFITYVTLMNDKNEVYVYSRTPAAGEERLHGKCSVGLGGHININDLVLESDLSVNVLESIHRCAVNEVKEEARIDLNDYRASVSKWIMSNDSAVDRQHLGWSIIVQVGDYDLGKSPELDHEFIGWRSIDEALEMNLESWSRKVLQDLV